MVAIKRVSCRDIASGAIAIVAVVLQIFPLFWGRSFYLDWVNHAWITQYYADYLVQNGQFPGTIDAEQAFGNPAPVFYGVFFYPIVALVACQIGADSALKATAAAMFILPLLAASMFCNRIMKSWPHALLVATVFNSSVYQLTNLYARSALTEFFANQFLLAGISLVMYGLLPKTKVSGAWIFLGFGCVTVACGTHPVTVYALAIFIVPVTIFSLIGLRNIFIKKQMIQLALAVGLSGLTIAPWAINAISAQPYLYISTSHIFSGSILYFPYSIDSLLGRIGYLYVDPRVMPEGIDATSTPFLDAPFSLGSLIFLLLVFSQLIKTWNRNAILLIAPAILVILVMLIAVWPPTGGFPGFWPGSIKAVARNGWLYAALVPIQFAYRLAGTWSLALTISAMLGLVAISVSNRAERLRKAGFRNATLAVALLSTIAIAQKTYITALEYLIYPAQLAASETASRFKESDNLILLKPASYRAMIKQTGRYPSTYVSQLDYSVPGSMVKTEDAEKPNSVELKFSRWESKEKIFCPVDCIITTNVIPSPTNEVKIDGKVVIAANLSKTGTLNFFAQSGDHSVEVSRVGRRFPVIASSILLMLTWMAVSTAYAAMCSLRRTETDLKS